MLSHIVAASENNIIGIKNGLPWKLPNDFKYFKNKTWGMPVIMGRNTYESLKKDLPGRINIVITQKKDWHPQNVFVSHTIDEAIDKAKESDAKEIFIIGGGKVFKDTINLVDRIYLTRVHTKVEGDTSYPEIDTSRWKMVREESHPADEKNNYPYTFEVWEKTDND
ncbi:MAG: dihydrofolate reductase [Bacteroidota bacterium]|nr:dihydrofolate reductase [Bacteroidota bacterium]